MNKHRSLIYVVLFLAVVVIFAVILAKNNKVQSNPATTSSPGDATTQAEDEAEEPQPTPSQLNGSDFEIVISTDEDEKRQLTLRFKDGAEPVNYVTRAGEKNLLKETLFSPATQFKLEKIFPDDVREALIITGKDLIPQGGGVLGFYIILKVHEDGLYETLSVMTESHKPSESPEETDSTEDNGGQVRLRAHVQLNKEESGQPTVKYSYQSEEGSGDILFKWDGKVFVDPSGTIDKIEDKYRP